MNTRGLRIGSSRWNSWLYCLVLVIGVVFGLSHVRASFSGNHPEQFRIIVPTALSELTWNEQLTLDITDRIICGNDPVNRHDPTGLAWVYSDQGWVWREASYSEPTGNPFTDAFEFASTLFYNKVPLPDVSAVGLIGHDIVHFVDDKLRSVGLPIEAINPVEAGLLSALTRSRSAITPISPVTKFTGTTFNPASFANEVARLRTASAVRHGVNFPGAELATMMARILPRGFSDARQFSQAGAELRAALDAAGLKYSRIGVRGSSVTGISRKGTGFRLTREGKLGPSDIDAFFELSESAGLRSSIQTPGFIHPDEVIRNYPSLERWSENWSRILKRQITPGGWNPGTLVDPDIVEF